MGQSGRLKVRVWAVEGGGSEGGARCMHGRRVDVRERDMEGGRDGREGGGGRGE